MKSEHRQLIRKLDRIFSEFIRLRHARNGISQCYTCGKTEYWNNEMQCGHYVKRGNKVSTRFDMINCQVQCKHCNEVLDGNLDVFAERLDSEYGRGTAEGLRLKPSKKIYCYELKELINKYQNEVKILKIKNNVK